MAYLIRFCMKIKLFLFLAVLCFFYSCKEEHSDKKNDIPTEIVQEGNDVKRSITGLTAIRGLNSKTDKATRGFVLFQPASSTKTYLLNLDGEIVHQWIGELNSMHSCLLEKGNRLSFNCHREFIFNGDA